MASTSGLPRRTRKPTVKFSAGVQKSPKKTAEAEMALMKAKFERKIKAMVKDHEGRLRAVQNQVICHAKTIATRDRQLTELKEEAAKYKTSAQVHIAKNVQLEADMAEWRSTGDNAVVEKLLNEAREQAKTQRQISLGYLAAMVKGQEDFSNVMSMWKVCEICTLQYESAPNTTPRVLPCGHTVCEGCIGNMTDKTWQVLRCPFDRLQIKMENRTAKNFPKNFLILNK